jgi:hypothetical protein
LASPDGRILDQTATATDIEDSKQTQEALRNALDEVQKSEAKLRQVIDTIPTLVWCDLAMNSPTCYSNAPAG